MPVATRGHWRAIHAMTVLVGLASCREAPPRTVAVAEDEDVVAHKVKVQKDPMLIHRKIQQKVQKMVLRPTLQMAPRIVAVVAVVQQEKMSLQERQLMKMAL